MLRNNIVPVGIAAGAIIVVLVLIFAVIVPSCSKSGGEPTGAATSANSGITQVAVDAKTEAQRSVESASQVGTLGTTSAKVQALVALLGEEETAKLVSQAKTNPEALWIAAHPDSYAFDGVETQYKVLRLAADDPEAVSFVRGFPSKYPMAEASTDSSLALGTGAPSASVPGTDIPHLYQWDRRWGYTTYGGTAFGLNAGAPTSLAMVYQGLTGSTDVTPYSLGTQAAERGFVLESGETANEMFTEMAGELGLECTRLETSTDAAQEHLAQGHPVIANVGPGNFTTSDHFIVLAGLADDGRVIVNDPYSATHSSQTWDLDTIVNESYALFGFTY